MKQTFKTALFAFAVALVAVVACVKSLETSLSQRRVPGRGPELMLGMPEMPCRLQCRHNNHCLQQGSCRPDKMQPMLEMP